MKIQEMIDVLIAYEEGEKIEYRNDNTNYKWTDVYIPSWNFHLSEYRVKPELKPRRFKLIKEYPSSPSIGTIVEFKTEQDFNIGIGNVAEIGRLTLSSFTLYPEFWEEIVEEKIYTHKDDLVGKMCIHKSGGFFYVIIAQGTEFLQLLNEVTGKQLTISYNNFNQYYKLC